MLRFLNALLSRNSSSRATAALSATNDLIDEGWALCLSFSRAVRHWTRPERSRAGLTIGALLDLRRSKPELVAENALLRHQLAILDRKTRRPKFTAKDRFLTVVLARLLPNWRDAVHIVKPATVIGWHRRLFKLYWRRKSRSQRRTLPPGTTALIRRIALENRNWGAEKIRGELLKLAIRVSKRTIQRIMWKARFGSDPNAGQTWHTFVNNHAKQIWACDFLHARDLLFRSVFAFFIMDVHTRRIVHFGVTRHPTDAWTTQQLREATAWDTKPDHLILDNDEKFGDEFKGLAKASEIDLVYTATEVPVMNSYIERFNGSVRRECLDHLLILSETGMRRMISEYVSYHNGQRPHQGLRQHIPAEVGEGAPVIAEPNRALADVEPAHRVDIGVVSETVLGGLHHHYYRIAA